MSIKVHISKSDLFVTILDDYLSLDESQFLSVTLSDTRKAKTATHRKRSHKPVNMPSTHGFLSPEASYLETQKQVADLKTLKPKMQMHPPWQSHVARQKLKVLPTTSIGSDNKLCLHHKRPPL